MLYLLVLAAQRRVSRLQTWSAYELREKDRRATPGDSASRRWGRQTQSKRHPVNASTSVQSLPVLHRGCCRNQICTGSPPTLRAQVSRPHQLPPPIAKLRGPRLFDSHPPPLQCSQARALPSQHQCQVPLSSQLDNLLPVRPSRPKCKFPQQKRLQTLTPPARPP